MYIQPCCIDRQLPEVLRKQKISFFQSMGDWTTQDLMKAVSCLVMEDCVAIMAIYKVDVYLLRTLRTYLAKGWYKGVVLLTHDDQTELIKGELSAYLPKVCYAHNKQIYESAFQLTNGHQFLTIIGDLLLENDMHFHYYSASYDTNRERFYEMASPFFARVKTSPAIKAEDEWVNAVIRNKY